MSAEISERERDSLDLLYTISRELTGELDLRDLLQRVLDLTMTNVEALSGSILVLDEEGKVSEGALAYDGGTYIYAFRGNTTGDFWRFSIEPPEFDLTATAGTFTIDARIRINGSTVTVLTWEIN